jgi:hypothetical protein
MECVSFLVGYEEGGGSEGGNEAIGFFDGTFREREKVRRERGVDSRVREWGIGEEVIGWSPALPHACIIGRLEPILRLLGTSSLETLDSLLLNLP